MSSFRRSTRRARPRLRFTSRELITARRRLRSVRNVELPKKVRSIIRRKVELDRALVISWNGAAVSQSLSTLAMSLVTNISGGSGVNQRVGNQCILQEVSFNYGVSWVAATAATSIRLRQVMVLDRQPVIGTPPNIGDVIDMGTNPIFFGQQNWGNRKRFTILRDKIFTLGMEGILNNGAGAVNTKQFRFRKRFKGGRLLSWQDATGTNVIGPHIYFLHFTAEADNSVAAYGHVVVKYKEL